MDQNDKQGVKQQIQNSLSQILQQEEQLNQQIKDQKINKEVSYKKVFVTKCQDAVFALSISKNNQLMASGSEDGQILLWDLQTQVIKQTYVFQNNEKDGTVNSLDFSFDNKYLGAACWKEDFDIIFIYDLQNIQNILPKFELKGHVSSINFITFARDSLLLMSGASDCTFKIWNIEEQACIQEFAYQQEVCGMAESFNQQIITSNLDSGLVILYEHKQKKYSKIYEWSPHGETDKSEGQLNTCFSEGEGEEYLYTSFDKIKIWSVKQLLTTNSAVPLKVFQEQKYIFGPIYIRCNNKYLHSCMNQIVCVDVDDGNITLVDAEEYYFSYPSFNGQYIVGSSENNLYLFILNNQYDE